FRSDSWIRVPQGRSSRTSYLPQAPTCAGTDIAPVRSDERVLPGRSHRAGEAFAVAVPESPDPALHFSSPEKAPGGQFPGGGCIPGAEQFSASSLNPNAQIAGEAQGGGPRGRRGPTSALICRSGWRQ